MDFCRGLRRILQHQEARWKITHPTRIRMKIFSNKLTRRFTLLHKAIFHQRGLDFNDEMRDRLLVLLLLGVGVIKVCKFNVS